MIKTVIFDLDGTLADTIDDLRCAMNRMLETYGYPLRSREDILRAINHGGRYFVAKSLPDDVYKTMDDDIVTEALGRYSAFYRENFCVYTHPFDGIPYVLDELKKKNIKLAVLSNKQDPFVKTIIGQLFPNVFDIVMGHGEYPEKPDPSSALAIADRLSSKPTECAFIGDSDVDMNTAVNAGMNAIGVAWGYRSPELLEKCGAKLIASSGEELLSEILSL